MTIRSPVSAIRPIWYDAQQVDETDLTTEQVANETIESSIINNQVGYGVLAESLQENVIFDSSLFVGILDGLAIEPQGQPADPNLGNQLSITLTGSAASGTRRVKVAIIGLNFQQDLQYETFWFDTNETQITQHHYTKVLVLLFNDLVGNPILSFNLGGRIVITDANPMTLSRDVVMIAQNQQPNLFFRDFFLDFSVSNLTLLTVLQNAMPLYSVSSLNIYTEEEDQMVLSNGDVVTQIGQKFQATTNNIQKITLLLSVQNNLGSSLVWEGDLVVSIYPLQVSLDCSTDLVPSAPINYPPSNVPVAQITYNYTTLSATGIVLDETPQPVDFIFSNTPMAAGNIIIPGQYYAITLKRSGAANQCDILIATGKDLLTNSQITTYSGTLWVDITTQDLWFMVWTDAAKVSDGQGYDAGNGVSIPKTILNTTTNTTVDNVVGDIQFVGSQTYSAVAAAITQDSVPVTDQLTGNPVDSRQQYIPQITLYNSVNLQALEQTSEPLIIGTIVDSNIKSFSSGNTNITSYLYSATLVKDQLLVRIVDDPTDTVRFNTLVSGLATNLLNGAFINANFTPDVSAPQTMYRIASATLETMIVGDVDGNGIIDVNDLNLLNTFLGYNLNQGLPLNTIIAPVAPDGYSFINGYETLTQPFANLFGVVFALINNSTGQVVADGYDGVLVANPTVPSLAQFTSSSVNFSSFVGLSSYSLLIFSTGANQANYGGWVITGLDTTDDVITLQKIYITPETFEQMFRADINGDFAITEADGYLLESYINRYPNPTIPAPSFEAPTTNPYNKIGTTFNVVRFRVEELVDRNDDYAANPNQRNATVHPVQDIFASDGYFANHDFLDFPITMTFVQQLAWEPFLVIASSIPKLVPTIFTSETGLITYPCNIIGVQENVYPVVSQFDPGNVNVFAPNNIIIGTGQLLRPNGDYYQVDFEVGTIILEVPTTMMETEQTIDIMNDFVIDQSGMGTTRKGYPSMRFADCSFVSNTALANNQVQFAVSMQSFSPNINGETSDGYYGIIVDGKMGVRMNPMTGILTLNFSNLYQDVVLQTLNTKVQITVFLKKAGFNNVPVFVPSVQVMNLLGN